MDLIETSRIARSPNLPVRSPGAFRVTTRVVDPSWSRRDRLKEVALRVETFGDEEPRTGVDAMTLMIAAGVWFAVAAVAARAVGTMLREANERTTRPASP